MAENKTVEIQFNTKVLADGAKANSLQVCYRYKPYGGTFGSWTTMPVSISGTQYAATAAITGLDYQTAYVFECYAQDALTTVYSASRAVKAAPVFDWSETDFCFRVPVAMESGVTISAAKLTAQDSLDTIKTNGWYYWEWGDPPMGIPDSTGANYMRAMRVWTGNGGTDHRRPVFGRCGGDLPGHSPQK